MRQLVYIATYLFITNNHTSFHLWWKKGKFAQPSKIPKILWTWLKLLVPIFSRKFHLQTSKMVPFVTIAIANIVFYWVMVLYGQSLLSLCMIFFFCVSVCCWIHLVPHGSRRFQLVPDGFSLFQVVPPCSRWFHLVPAQSSFTYFDSDFICFFRFSHFIFIIFDILTFSK